MNKITDFFDKLYTRISGAIFGVLSFIFGVIGIILGLLFSPDYIFWKKSISILGHHPGGIFLRVGLIISNIFAILLFIYMGRKLKCEEIDEKLIKISVVSGIFVSITGVLTETFSGVNNFIHFLHGAFMLISFLGGMAVTFLFGFLMEKNKKFSKYISNFSYFVSGLFIAFLIPFFITNFCNLFSENSEVYSFGQDIYTIMPTLEWIIIFSILFWYLINSIYFLKHKI